MTIQRVHKGAGKIISGFTMLIAMCDGVHYYAKLSNKARGQKLPQALTCVLVIIESISLNFIISKLTLLTYK